MLSHHVFNCFAVIAFVLATNLSVSLVSGFSTGQLGTQRARSASVLSSTKESDIEKLLRKARELRAEAEASEKEVHHTLITKKKIGDAETDRIIDNLFPSSSGSLDELVERLRGKRLSADTLKKVVTRLYGRECAAKGLEHVTASVRLNKEVEFTRVKENKDEVEAARIVGLISQLIAGVAVLDDEFLKGEQAKGQKFNSDIENNHWNAGNCAKTLSTQVREMRREQSEQFKKRQEEYTESLKNKKDSTEHMNLLS